MGRRASAGRRAGDDPLIEASAFKASGAFVATATEGGAAAGSGGVGPSPSPAPGPARRARLPWEASTCRCAAEPLPVRRGRGVAPGGASSTGDDARTVALPALSGGGLAALQLRLAARKDEFRPHREGGSPRGRSPPGSSPRRRGGPRAIFPSVSPFRTTCVAPGKGDGGDRREQGNPDDGYQQSLHIRNNSPLIGLIIRKSIS